MMFLKIFRMRSQSTLLQIFRKLLIWHWKMKLIQTSLNKIYFRRLGLNCEKYNSPRTSTLDVISKKS